MSFTDDYNALKKKRKQQEKEKVAASSGTKFEKQYYTQKVDREPIEEDIAPVRKTEDEPVLAAKTAQKQDTRRWFEKGAFEDGYQFGDVLRTISSSSQDLGNNLTAGLLGIGEKAVDFGARIVRHAGEITGNDDLKEKTEKFIEKDLYDEKKLAKKINAPSAYISNKILGIGDVDEGSALGEKTDDLAYSGGQLLGTAALQSVGVPWYVTTGVTAYGGEIDVALNEGATFEDASTRATISAGAEILTEMLFGGSGLGEKGLINLDALTNGISSKAVKLLADYGVDMAAEGTEEIASKFFSTLGQQLTVEKEDTWRELLTNEKAMDAYLAQVGESLFGKEARQAYGEAFIGGMALGGGANVGKVIHSAQTGRDYRTGLTDNEQSVVDRVYEERVAEAEKSGEKLSKKDKDEIYNSVLEDMDNGYIDTDTIESVLGGEDYSNYQRELKRQEELDNELNELRNMKSGDMTDIQAERMAELKAMKPNTEMVNSLKFNIDEKVRGALGQNSRLSESYREAERRTQKFDADLSKYDEKQRAVVQKAIDSGILNNTNRTRDFVDMVAKISADKGVLFDFTNNEKLKASGFAVNGAAVNGYVTADGVTLNIDSRKAVNSVVGHEITHVLEGTELYTELQTALFEYAKSKGDYQGRYDTLAELYKNVEGADIDAELTADLVGDYLFTDQDFVNNLSTQHRNVFQKIYDEIKYLLKMATAGSKEARELERVKRAFEAAYRESGKVSSDTKYSLSDSDGKALTKEQGEYFKDSKMRDENGALKVMYHGSQNAGFHIFDPSMSDDNTSLFFVDRNDVAASYSGTSETYEARSFRTIEEINAFFEETGSDGYKVVPEKNGKFSLLEEGEFIATSDSLQEIYDEYRDWAGVGYGEANYKVYLNLTNPLEVDAQGREWNRLMPPDGSKEEYRYIKVVGVGDVPGQVTIEYAMNSDGKPVTETVDIFTKFNEQTALEISDMVPGQRIEFIPVNPATTREYAQYAKENGYDGVILKNVRDNGGYSNGSEGASTVAIAFSSEQVKSVANTQPTTDKDIRYSLSEDSEGRQLTDAQKAKFEGSKVVDENGKLKAVYHGSPADFNEFSLNYLGTNGTNEGYGFYFTDSKRIADGYSKGENGDGRLFEVYLDIKKPLSDTEVTISRAQFKKLLVALNNQVDADGERLDILSNYGDVEWEGLNKVLNYAIELEYDGNDNDVDIISSLVNSSGNLEAVYRVLREVTGYDGIIVNEAEWGGDQTIYIAFHPEQIKNVDNLNPTDDPDIRHSLSEDGETPKEYGKWNVYGKDIRYTPAEEIAPVQDSVQDSVQVAPVAEKETTTEKTPSAILYNKRDGANGWGEVYGTAQEALNDAVKHISPELWTAFSDEFDNTNGKNPVTPITNALIAVQEDVRQETITPMQGAQLLVEAYNHGGVNTLKRLYNPKTGNLYDPYLEKAKQYDTVAPVAEPESAAPSAVGLAEIAKTARREEMRGAYVQDGKQYISNGSFIAELNTVDESLEQSENFPIKRVQKELAEVFDRQLSGKYELDTSITDGYIKVGDSLFDAKYVNAAIGAIENPEFSLSAVRGGDNALLVTGDNGRVVLMPVRASDNANVAYEARLIDDTATDDISDIAPSEPTLQELEQKQDALYAELMAAIDGEDGEAVSRIGAEYDNIARTVQQMKADESERFYSLDDADAPPEVDAPYYDESAETADPFEDRDIKAVGDRKVKAYMYENPEVKPFFQEEARVLLGELENAIKGERIYTPTPDGQPGVYGAESYGIWSGVKRHVSPEIAHLLDDVNMSYADIEKGLKAIIEDNGAENIAAAKKIEFVLNDRLLNGYQEQSLGMEIPPNQDYINLVNEKQITAYTDEARQSFFESVGATDIAPVAEKYESIRPPKQTAEPRMKRVEPEQKKAGDGKIAEVLTEEPKVKKSKTSAWAMFKNNVLDKGMVFEDLALATRNRELQARWNSIRYAEGKAQRFIENGKANISSLKSIRETVENSGKTQQFYEYLYHLHNVDRMSLEGRGAESIAKWRDYFKGLTEKQIQAIAAKEITDSTTEKTANGIRGAKEYLSALEAKNKPVFGDDVTAEVSKETAAKLEKANPEFVEWANEVYGYMNYLREELVANGVISRDTAKLWAEIYPHYVPIRRAGKDGAAINVPLDTGRTGINAPIKRATGGNSDILPLFDTMGQRTIQTYRAIAKNRFGVELKNTLGTTIGNETAGVDDAIDSIDTDDGLLQEGKDGNAPTFTVFENGERVTFEITEEMYDAMKPTSKGLSYTNKVANTVGNIFRGLLTEYNPVFLTTNAVKDVQDILINSQHAARTYATIPKAIAQMATKGHWYQEYLNNGGERNTYFENDSNTFKKEDGAVKKIVGMPLRAISAANNVIEKVPRLAEYIASRESGRSVDVSMLDAARVTTNFAAGGDLTKMLNRNGFNFLNASTQGAVQQVRNIREAKANGLKGWVQLAAKVTLAGLPALLLNDLLWDDDEEYEELADYVKDNYYIVAKYGDGQFVRIPKGRTLAVIQNAFEQMQNMITGDDEVDLNSFLELAISNLAPNNPLDNNIIAPITQTLTNKAWYGDDIVPTRLQDLPAAEQFDESTDAISKWLGEKLNVSPYKLNYLLNQYSGGVGDVFLPMLTPETDGGGILAPFTDKFTTDSVLNNQNVSDFYDTMDELTKAAKSSKATDEDILSYKYMNSVNSKLGELYAEKREIQNSNLSDKEKREAVREIQAEIDGLARESLETYGSVNIQGGYANVGDIHYRRNNDGEWQKITDKQLQKQNDVTRGLGISASEYWGNKEEYDYAYDNPEKYAVAKSVGGYQAYRTYSSELYDIKGVDLDGDGRSDSGTRKEKVLDYINGLDIDYGERLILFKSEYNADDTYNYEIIDYLNSRQDISYEDTVTILKELGFTVDSEGNITWD